MRIKKTICRLLVFIMLINCSSMVIAKKTNSSDIVNKGLSIRVVDYETYLDDIKIFNERISGLIDKDKLRKDIVILSPDVVAYRTSLYQSIKGKNTIKPRFLYGDGYVQGNYYHELTYYNPNSAITCYYYACLGYVRLENHTSSTATLSYEQQNTVTAQGSLSTTCTISTSAELSMLNFAKMELGVDVATSATMQAGTTFGQQAGASVSVPPFETRRITAYYDGVYVGGTAYYNIYDETMGVPGMLIEVDDDRPTTDQVVQTNGISLVISDN
ncbi:MAG: hypothetical protein BWX97_01971 [Firmicutes bacterium ADurb.Bin146]|jgi:hypothetical protein|nr:MAG: hypothetical protein BWX97_01971 [Firmicutes bacterium ADurb.Bin146]